MANAASGILGRSSPIGLSPEQYNWVCLTKKLRAPPILEPQSAIDSRENAFRLTPPRRLHRFAHIYFIAADSVLLSIWWAVSILSGAFRPSGSIWGSCFFTLSPIHPRRISIIPIFPRWANSAQSDTVYRISRRKGIGRAKGRTSVMVIMVARTALPIQNRQGRIHIVSMKLPPQSISNKRSLSRSTFLVSC